MKIVEIVALPNGAHRNQTGGVLRLPEGWAVIPDGMVCASFPFGEIEVEEIGGIMTVTRWIPGVMPEPAPEPEPETEEDMWAELDAAYTEGYREGVDSV